MRYLPTTAWHALPERGHASFPVFPTRASDSNRMLCPRLHLAQGPRVGTEGRPSGGTQALILNAGRCGF